MCLKCLPQKKMASHDAGHIFRGCLVSNIVNRFLVDMSKIFSYLKKMTLLKAFMYNAL